MFLNNHLRTIKNIHFVVLSSILDPHMIC